MWFFERRSGKDRRCWGAREDACKHDRRKEAHRGGAGRRSGKERRVVWEDHRGRKG